jgi:hypothetical protein
MPRADSSGYVCQYCFAEIPKPVESIDPWQAACRDCFAFIIQTADPLEQAFRAGALMAARESNRKGEKVRQVAQKAESVRKLKGIYIKRQVSDE